MRTTVTERQTGPPEDHAVVAPTLRRDGAAALSC